MTEIDRRKHYYERAAEFIAADPLDFYTRAERGRRLQLRLSNLWQQEPAMTVDTTNIVKLRRATK